GRASLEDVIDVVDALLAHVVRLAEGVRDRVLAVVVEGGVAVPERQDFLIRQLSEVVEDAVVLEEAAEKVEVGLLVLDRVLADGIAAREPKLEVLVLDEAELREHGAEDPRYVELLEDAGAL